MSDQLTITHAAEFLACFALFWTVLGFWLGRMFSKWHEKRLVARIDRQKFEILMLDPKRSFHL